MENAPTADTTATDYQLVTTLDGVQKVAAELKSAGRFAMRVLPDSPAAVRAGIVGLAFSIAPRQAWYIPVGHVDGSQVSDGAVNGGPKRAALPASLFELPDDDASAPLRSASSAPSASSITTQSAILDALKSVLEDPAVEKIGHDLKFDTIVLARHGIELAGVGLDTMLASYLLDSTRTGHPLEPTALEHLSYKALTEEDVCGRGAKAVSLAHVSPEAALNYAGERSDLALQLANRLSPMLTTDGLDALYNDIERPLTPVLARMEQAGVRLDARALAAQSSHIERELARRSEQIYELAGGPFNINSPPQLSKILFDKLQLPALKRNVKTKTASTAVEVLEELALAHELPQRSSNGARCRS
jgi:DNA polymerase-1